MRQEMDILISMIRPAKEVRDGTFTMKILKLDGKKLNPQACFGSNSWSLHLHLSIGNNIFYNATIYPGRWNKWLLVIYAQRLEILGKVEKSTKRFYTGTYLLKPTYIQLQRDCIYSKNTENITKSWGKWRNSLHTISQGDVEGIEYWRSNKDVIQYPIV